MNKPLLNKTVVITRDPKQARTLKEKIEILGGQSVLFPTISIEPPVYLRRINAAITSLSSYDWLVFTSVNAVRFFFEQVNKLKLPLPAFKSAAIGSKTAAELKTHGVTVNLLPDEATAKGLLQALSEKLTGNERVLLPTSSIGRDEIVEGLKKIRVKVDRIAVYRTIANRQLDNADMRRQINEKQIDCLTFFSPSAFIFFVELMGDLVVQKINDTKVAIAAIGPTTAAAIRSKNLPVAIEPKQSTEDALLEALSAYFSNNL